MIKYSESRPQGTAKCSVNGIRQALVHFDLFLASLDKPLPLFDQLTEAQFNISLIQLFGTYLIENAKDVHTGDCLMAATMLQFLSAVKAAIEVKFPKIPIFNQLDWYITLRHDVEKRAKRQLII